MEGSPVKDIIAMFNQQQYDQYQLVYAVYSWIALNVAYDCQAGKNGQRAVVTASSVLKDRRTIGVGYANLFQAMCDVARIHCVTIEGYAKSTPDCIGEFTPKSRHAWNAVQIRGIWYYVDAAWGAGYTDVRRKQFTKDFSDVWVFADRDMFALSHLPDKKNWHFEEDTVTRPQYVHAPVICSGALRFETMPAEGLRGRIRGRQEVCKPVTFDLKNPDLIKQVGIGINGEVQPAEFSIYNKRLMVEIPFKKAGTHYVTVYFNGKPAYQFRAEVERKSS